MIWLAILLSGMIFQKRGDEFFIFISISYGGPLRLSPKWAENFFSEYEKSDLIPQNGQSIPIWITPKTIWLLSKKSHNNCLDFVYSIMITLYVLYCCILLLPTRYFLPWTRSRAWRVSQRRSWKDLVLLTTSPQWTFFVTQTQDGLWNIVHLCFFIFHMMMSKRVLHTYTGQARSKKKRKNSY